MTLLHPTNKKYYIVITMFLSFLVSQAQNNNQDFSNVLDNLLKIRPVEYDKLSAFLTYQNRDTTKMRILLNKSIAENYKSGEAYANTRLGSLYRNKSFFTKSRLLFNRSLTIARENDLIEYEIISLNMLGVIDRRQDNIRAALDYHQDALALAEAQTQKTPIIQNSIAVSLNSMGNIFLKLNQKELALNAFNKSLKIGETLNNTLGLAINHQNIGQIHENNGDLDLALKSFKTSLDYNEQLDNDIGRIICNNNIGSIYIKQKKPEEALKVIQPTIALAEEKQDQFYITFAHIRLGRAQNQLEQLDLAKINLEKGLRLAKKYSLKSAIAEANRQLSSVNNKKGHYKMALGQFQTAVEIEQTINNETNAQYVNRLRYQYEEERQTSQIKTLAAEKLKLEKSNRTFFISIYSLVALCAGLFFFYRHRQLTNEKMILTLEQDMLRSQMNPHFIFNSLNSIKLYIINNEKENAVYYLNKFSKLIRKILVASTEKENFLSKELETMELYMNIENIRFSNDIKYTYHINKNVNLNQIKVPSLVLQPFLENALWHGLSSKQGEKTIHIEISKQMNDFVRIAITDNGIGREASAKIKNNKLLKRKSVGIDLTKQRLENFSKRYINTYKIKIEDLYNKELAIGTRVTIDIPTLEIFKLKTA